MHRPLKVDPHFFGFVHIQEQDVVAAPFLKKLSPPLSVLLLVVVED